MAKIHRNEFIPMIFFLFCHKETHMLWVVHFGDSSGHGYQNFSWRNKKTIYLVTHHYLVSSTIQKMESFEHSFDSQQIQVVFFCFFGVFLFDKWRLTSFSDLERDILKGSKFLPFRVANC